MSGRRVNFRESPPSSSVSSRYNTSDSGHGLASDTPSSSRYSSGGGSLWTDLPALQDAYRTVLAERDDWKNRAEELEAEVVEAQKLTSEAEAKWRAMVESNEQLEDEKKKLFKENKELKIQVEEVDELQDQVNDLNQKLAEANARFNEMPHNLAAPAYGALGTSPYDHHGHADNINSSSGTKSSSRHGKEGKSSSSNKSSSNAGSGTSSGGSSHSSSRAKVGSSSSTSTAKLSRSGSSRHGDRDRERERERERDRDRDHHPAKDQKTRLSQRFDHKDDVLLDSNGSATSAASSSSQKHHKSGSSGQGSSGSNGSSTSADSMGMRPPPTQQRVRRGSYIEGYGPGPAKPAPAGLSGSSPSGNIMPTPMSPNKGVSRSAPAPSVMGVTGGPTAGGYYPGFAQAPLPQAHQAHQYAAPPPPSASGLISPRGDSMGKDGGMRPKVHIVDEMSLDPYQQEPQYYRGYPPARDPRLDPRISSRR
ncbi:hypothetical protein Sste5346_001992 [Sporothrix stenoceras]|uniref:Uncharacterized protein n=1 Tax=Sporothrix stenoceras TaxID=5173 RepID=A0ABR3ZJU6_9PEZI